MLPLLQCKPEMITIMFSMYYETKTETWTELLKKQGLELPSTFTFVKKSRSQYSCVQQIHDWRVAGLVAWTIGLSFCGSVEDNEAEGY